MRKCWKIAPDERPSFDKLSNILDQRLQTLAGYMDLAMTLQLEEDTVNAD